MTDDEPAQGGKSRSRSQLLDGVRHIGHGTVTTPAPASGLVSRLVVQRRVERLVVVGGRAPGTVASVWPSSLRCCVPSAVYIIGQSSYWNMHGVDIALP